MADVQVKLYFHFSNYAEEKNLLSDMSMLLDT